MARGTDAVSAPTVNRGLPGFPRSILLALAFAAFSSLGGGAAGAADLHGRVVGVPDGDTVRIVDGDGAIHSVRLAGIDAPERSQRYGGVARDGLAGRVFGRDVVVSWHKRDRYGRLVGEVRVKGSNGCSGEDCPGLTDVGFEQVAAGLAWHYRQYENEQAPEQRRRYALAEQAARARRDGLWKDERPVPPWEYRGSRRAGTPAG